VLVAFGAARPQRGVLERLTPDTITDRAALSAELDTVRACGYATAVGELEPGLVAVAAPVLDADGRAVAAISISGPEFRIPSDRLDGFGRLLTKETETLSARLGYRPAGEGAA
jgi:DNA-binding IclR family transcriptional regulator